MAGKRLRPPPKRAKPTREEATVLAAELAPVTTPEQIKEAERFAITSEQAFIRWCALPKPRHITTLFADLKNEGYRVSYATLNRWRAEKLWDARVGIAYEERKALVEQFVVHITEEAQDIHNMASTARSMDVMQQAAMELAARVMQFAKAFQPKDLDEAEKALALAAKTLEQMGEIRFKLTGMAAQVAADTGQSRGQTLVQVNQAPTLIAEHRPVENPEAILAQFEASVAVAGPRE